MFERFTDQARWVVVRAQEEARRRDHHYIGTEHLLLGVLRSDDSVAVRALLHLGVSLAEVRSRVDELLGPGQGPPGDNLPFTPRAKHALELALRESVEGRHRHLGPEHLLVGLIREGDGVAGTVLTRVGADLDRVRDAVAVVAPEPPPA